MRAYLVALTAIVAVTAAASPCAAEGFRAEIHGGWDRPEVDDDGDSGIVYGLGLGYDFDIGQTGFVGVDLSIDDSTQRECDTSVIAAGDRVCVSSGRDLAAGIRGGIKVGDRSKVYALAGYTNARFRASYRTPGGVVTRDGENLDGFRLGAGYEHGFGENLYGKVEYRYSNYEADVERHQLLFGVGINF